jgi:hypothetical protein
MRAPSRASQRFSRVLVLDKAVDSLNEHVEETEALAAIEQERGSLEAVENAKLPGRLPPTDRGLNAWLFMFSAFTIEAIMWGK